MSCARDPVVLIADHLDASVRQGAPLSLGEMARLASALRTIAFCRVAQAQAADVERAVRVLVGIPVPPMAVSNVVPLRARLRAHADHISGDGGAA